MRKLHLALLAAVVIAGPTFAQTAAKAPATGTVKAVQPGLLEVAGPRVNEAMAAGIRTITATPGKGGRSIHVSSQYGDSYYGWPKKTKQVAFSVEVGKPAGGATISAPGFTEANKADYKAAIDAIFPFAISSTKMAMDYSVQ